MPLGGGRAGPERGGTTDDLLLELAFARVEEREREACAVTEAAIERPLADAHLLGHAIHRYRRRSLLVEEAAGRGEDQLAVTGGVAALARPAGDGEIHGLTVSSGCLARQSDRSPLFSCGVRTGR